MSQPPPLHEHRVVVVHGVEYFVYWEHMPVGASFFLPTTATARQVMTALRPIAKGLRYRLLAQPRREYGRFGVRVWRVG